MTIEPERQVDIIDLLLADHSTAKALFEHFTESMGDQDRERWFRELTKVLVQHESAEEATIYPVVRGFGESGESVAEARVHEHTVAERLLRSMEHLDVMSAAFTSGVAKLHGAVLRHVQLEESEVFPFLAERTATSDREELARRYERYRHEAPTHPHPHVPHTPPGNRVGTPLAAGADRIRDALRSPDDVS